MKWLHLALILWLTGCGDVKQPELGADILQYPKAKLLTDFQLKQNNQDTFTIANLTGRWTLFFLGYTYCPDICPTTLTELNNIYPQLKKLIPEIQIVFVSADPQRDTLVKLDQYIQFFNPDFVAVTAEHQQLLPFTRQLGLVYSMTGEGNSYLVNHSASFSIVNPNQELVAQIKPNFKLSPPAIDYVQLMQFFEKVSLERSNKL